MKHKPPMIASLVLFSLLSVQGGDFAAKEDICDLVSGGREDGYAWRGYMLDVSRHFFPVSDIKKTLDAISLAGINVFHWHLTDNHGWRIEIDAYPELTARGSVRGSSTVRMSTMSKNTVDGRYGPYFYTKAEAREIVSYAESRGIQVVPEIDIPGHSAAAIRAYPELACTGAGNSQELCLGKDSTVRFYERILDEMLEIFPAKVIHLGGDECNQHHWQKCPDCQRRIRQLHLRGEKGLQGWFMIHFAKYLEVKGRRMVAWDDVVDFQDLPKSVIVMAYRRTKCYGQKAARRGYDVVSAAGMYLDFVQGLSDDPYEYQPFGYVCTWRKLLAKDLSEGYNVEARKHLIGGEACMWTELVCDIAEVEWHTWPRLAAIGRMLSKGPSRDFDDFECHWTKIESKLHGLNVNTARIGLLFDEELHLEPGVKCLWRREDFAKMLPNPLDESILCFDWNDKKDKYRKVYARKVVGGAPGSYLLDMDWARIELTASDDRGFSNGLRQMRKLVRVKFGGVLELPSCRLGYGDFPRDNRTLDELISEKTFVTEAGKVFAYHWHEPRHMLLGSNYPLVVFRGTESESADLILELMERNNPSFFCYPDSGASDSDVRELVSDLKWRIRNLDGDAVRYVGKGHGN